MKAVVPRTLFVLAVPDLERSGAFYRDVLRFEVRVGGPGSWMFVKDGCRILAGACSDSRRSSSTIISYFGYLVIDDVYVYYKRPFVVTIESLTSGW
jgi:catechol 2,3-dioxygenase-like lactoylglutathione lyase family enzyme